MLSHINSEFSCYAYVYYRRLEETTELAISVVILSMFVIDEKKEEQIKQLNDHMQQGYILGGKGASFKTVDTKRNLEMCLVCTEVESASVPIKIDLRQLDTVGCVVRHKPVAIESPASASINIYEKDTDIDENSLLWELYLDSKTEGEIAQSNLKFITLFKSL